MNIKKLIGLLCILIGGLVLFYKNAGFSGFGGYVDKSYENIAISATLIIVGFLIIKPKKSN
ncbi:hypothetical protein F7018_17055 [Tenacibaculum aiptasiae]|uniref:DUF3098 domain-containing protein n=1 Tax=Tenacibaculum aiptasiae TaxID=426481 RepID=A0A7J5A762_9FLAO|nr:hypothetical protein [Tenacibaculum aiptasiae]KAB1153375.1 hypothetical protein F7018_17055 [Tenacibaculum aiptasiae]